jgi:hypothetical protein
MWDGHCYNKHHVGFAAKLCEALMPDEYRPVRCSCCQEMVPISNIRKAVISDHIHLAHSGEGSMIRDTGYSLNKTQAALLMPRSHDLEADIMEIFSMMQSGGEAVSDDLCAASMALADKIYKRVAGKSLFIACEKCDRRLKARDYMCEYQIHLGYDLCCKSQAVLTETAASPASAPVKLQPNPMYSQYIVDMLINQQEGSGNTKSLQRELSGALRSMRCICACCGKCKHVLDVAHVWLSDHSHAKAHHPGYSLESLEARKSLKPQVSRQYRSGYDGRHEECSSYTASFAEWEASLKALENQRLFIMCDDCRDSAPMWCKSNNVYEWDDACTTISVCVGCAGKNCLGKRVVQVVAASETAEPTPDSKAEAVSSSK